MDFERATHEDFLEIVRDLEDFWGSDRTRQHHQPMWIHEFGDTAWVLREEGRVVAYLFCFFAQTGPVGYIQLVGVRRSHQRRGIGRDMYRHFESVALDRGCTELKAITAPINAPSIAFHRTLGFELLGQPNADDVPVVADYAGPGEPMVVFRKRISSS